MKFKFINARVAAISLALMIIDAGPSQAATAILSGGSSNTCTYTSFSANSSGDISITCASNVNNTPPTEIPVCSPTASVNPVVANGLTVLSANCSGAPTGYVWSTNPSSSFTSSGSTVGVNPSVATTYSVIANNGVGPSVAKEVTVTISVVNTSPPPTGLLTMVDWNKAFSNLNNIPYNAKTAVSATYEYFKVLYLAKPYAYILPGGTLLTQ
jgi:hypothetical protein